MWQSLLWWRATLEHSLELDLKVLWEIIPAQQIHLWMSMRPPPLQPQPPQVDLEISAAQTQVSHPNPNLRFPCLHLSRTARCPIPKEAVWFVFMGSTLQAEPVPQCLLSAMVTMSKLANVLPADLDSLFRVDDVLIISVNNQTATPVSPACQDIRSARMEFVFWMIPTVSQWRTTDAWNVHPPTTSMFQVLAGNSHPTASLLTSKLETVCNVYLDGSSRMQEDLVSGSFLPTVKALMLLEPVLFVIKVTKPTTGNVSKELTSPIVMLLIQLTEDVFPVPIDSSLATVHVCPSLKVAMATTQ